MSSLVQDAIEHLHAQGGRMTVQRLMILEALECLGCHPTAEEIYEVVRQRDASLNLSTVYRTLRWLEQEGLISARRFEEGGRQERFDPALPAEHHHFLCTQCKSVVEFHAPQVAAIKAQFEAQSGAQVESGSLMLYGVCRACQQQNGPAALSAVKLSQG